MNGSLAQPGRSLLTMAIETYTSQGNTLRLIAKMEPSVRERGFNDGKKEEILKQLRTQFETGKKLFNFALINASTYFYRS